MSKMNTLSPEAAEFVTVSSLWTNATFNAPGFLAISSRVDFSLELDSTFSLELDSTFLLELDSTSSLELEATTLELLDFGDSLELETTTLELDDSGAFSIVAVIF